MRQIWVQETDLSDVMSELSPGPETVSYVNGERSLVRRAVDLLLSVGVISDGIISKAYWRKDQANASHGEPSHE